MKRHLGSVVALGIMLAAAPSSAAQQKSEQGSERNCENPQTQQDMNYCAHQDYLAADVLLNEQWSATAAVMHLRDENWEDPNDSDRPGYFEAMLTAQRAWLIYRDSHCASEGYLFRGGSIESLIVSTCLTRMTQQRTTELHQLESLE